MDAQEKRRLHVDARQADRDLEELYRLRAEVTELREELRLVRSSKWFLLRERLLPPNSLPQRAYKALRSGKGLAEIRRSVSRYPNWCAEHDTLASEDHKKISDEIAAMANRPKFSILLPVYNVPSRFLSQAIKSVQAQLYPDWELCIVDDASPDPQIRPLLERFAAEDQRIKVRFRSENGHISQASNDALEMATSAYIGFLDHDDLLREHTLYCVAKVLIERPEVKFIYSDEDKIDAKGKRFEPHFKPDWDPWLELGMNYTCHFSVYDAKIARDIQGLRVGFEGSQDWDFTLRFVERIAPNQIVHIPHILYHWRAISGSTAMAANQKPYVREAQIKTAEEAFQRRSIPADSTRLDAFGVMHNQLHIESPPPRVSVLIPTRDGRNLLERCVKTLKEITNYPDFEVIVVDNGSTDPGSLQYLQDLKSQPGIRVLPLDEPFNYSRLNNFAATHATGTVLALLNNDIEIIEPNWMRDLVAYAIRPDIGAVGPRLLYPNGKVQHGGVILGLGGIAQHAHVGLDRTSPGYANRAIADQSISAVTGACLVVRKDRYVQVGGLNEEFAVAFNDIDFCLKLTGAGFRNIYCGTVSCVHHESASRGKDMSPAKRMRFLKESDQAKSRWGELLSDDPWYNPNLSLELASFELAGCPRMGKF